MCMISANEHQMTQRRMTSVVYERVPSDRETQPTKPHYLPAIVCALTCAQFTGYALYRSHAVRGVCDADTLMASEAMKLTFSVCVCVFQKKLYFPVLKSWLESLIPTLCFLIMNMIAFHCTTLVSASVFVVLMQLKLVFTSLLSYVCLDRSNSMARWFAVGFVALGCVGATRPPTAGIVGNDGFWWGVGGLVLETVVSSGCAVYMQRLLQVDLWMRNIQLASLSLVLYLAVHLFDARCAAPSTWGFNDIGLATLGAFGGIVVALTLRYAGATEKTLSTSMSIVITSAIESFLTGNTLTVQSAAASLTVILGGVLWAADRSPAV